MFTIINGGVDTVLAIVWDFRGVALIALIFYVAWDIIKRLYVWSHKQQSEEELC